MFFDTHTHFNDAQFDTDREHVLDACRKAKIGSVVEIADAPSEWDRAIALSRKYRPWIHCSLGLHPYYADQWTETMAGELQEKSSCPEAVAIGEIGLDYAKSPVPQPVQKEALVKLLTLSRDLDRPVVLHCRGAYPDMLAILKERFGASPTKHKYWGVLHCFSGNKEEALAAVRLGFALGVDGPITYPKNDSLREAILTAGLDSIVLETDSPYLPPQSSRGKRNDSRSLLEIAEHLARLFQSTTEDIARQTARNGEELYRLTA